jgi:hypothetical protein
VARECGMNYPVTKIFLFFFLLLGVALVGSRPEKELSLIL